MTFSIWRFLETSSRSEKRPLLAMSGNSLIINQQSLGMKKDAQS